MASASKTRGGGPCSVLEVSEGVDRDAAARLGTPLGLLQPPDDRPPLTHVRGSPTLSGCLAVPQAGLPARLRTVGQPEPLPAAPPARAASLQGPPALRWALFEAAQCARRRGSPDHAYYLEAAARLGGNRACLSVARKLLKRSYHTLRELGEEALRPA
jgi:hypothetical protein